MEKITCYKTSDGRIWESKTEANIHQNKIDALARLRTYIEVNEIGGFTKIGLDDFMDEMNDHFFAIRKILNFQESQTNEG